VRARAGWAAIIFLIGVGLSERLFIELQVIGGYLADLRIESQIQFFWRHDCDASISWRIGGAERVNHVGRVYSFGKGEPVIAAYDYVEHNDAHPERGRILKFLQVHRHRPCHFAISIGKENEASRLRRALPSKVFFSQVRASLKQFFDVIAAVGFRHSWEYSGVYPCLQRWRSADVFVNKFQINMGCWRENERSGNGSFDGQPRASAFPHLIQLALHGNQLFSENYGTDYASSSNYSSQSDHPSVASIDSINQRLVGYCCLAAVFLCSYFGILFLLRHDSWPRLGSRCSLTFGAMFMLASMALASQGISLIFR
jgi:hypothetical protein